MIKRTILYSRVSIVIGKNRVKPREKSFSKRKADFAIIHVVYTMY